MDSYIDDAFLKRLGKAPANIRSEAKRAYRAFRANPWDQRLHFKSVKGDFWSARVFQTGWRVIGLRVGEVIYWDFIGNHNDYTARIRSL